jgi:hypothetical protein
MGDRFVPIEVYEHTQFNKKFVYAWQETCPWLIAVRQEVLGETSLEVSLMTGLNRDDRFVSFNAEQTNQRINFDGFSISNDSTIAALGYKGSALKDSPIDADNQFIKLYKFSKSSRTFSVVQIEQPPDQSALVASVAWSPTGILHAIKVSDSKLSLYSYDRGAWRKVAVEEGDFNYAFRFVDPKIYFFDDGRPIVTWGARNPVD